MQAQDPYRAGRRALLHDARETAVLTFALHITGPPRSRSMRVIALAGAGMPAETETPRASMNAADFFLK